MILKTLTIMAMQSITDFSAMIKHNSTTRSCNYFLIPLKPTITRWTNLILTLVTHSLAEC